MGPILETKTALVPAVIDRRKFTGSDIISPTDALHVSDLDDVFTKIWKRRKTVAVLAIMGTLIAIAAWAAQAPMYRSTALVEVQGLNDNILNTRDVDPTASSFNSPMEPYLATQIRIVKSESVLARVVDKLKLTERSESIQSDGWLTRTGRSLGLIAPPKPLRRRDIIDWAAANLTVRIPGETHMIEISFVANSPKLAADMANSTVSEYIDRTLEMHSGSTRRTSEWLAAQLAQLKSRVENSEAEMQAYARRTGLLFTSERDNIAEQRLRQLQESLSRAHEARIAEQSKYELVNTASAESLPEVLDDEVLREYQTRLTDLRRQLAELRPVLAPGHYKVQQINAQIVELQGAVERKRANILDRIKNTFQAADHQEKMLAANYAAQVQLVSDQSVKAVRYNILKRELDTNRQLYDSMLQKAKEVNMSSAVRASNVTVVDDATPPKAPFAPQRALYEATGFGLGTFAGVGFALFPRRRRRRIDPPSEIVRQLGIPELGSIPLVRSKHGLARADLISNTAREHAMAESFRATMVSILLGGRGAYDGSHPRVIVISSCAAHEGRTTIAANLAIALAEANHKVLLVDADLRNPHLHKLFGVDNLDGLGSILCDTKACETYSPEQLGRATEIPLLRVLPSGPESPITAGLLHSARMMDLLRRVRTLFDTVVIDTPPVLSFADSRTVAKSSDGVALVIRVGQTVPEDVLGALQRFGEDGTPVLGTIVNCRHESPRGRRSERERSGRHVAVDRVPSILQPEVSRMSRV